MQEQDIISFLRLQCIDGVGDVTSKRLISHFGSASNVFKASFGELQRVKGVGEVLIKNILDPCFLDKAEEEYKYITDNKINFCTYLCDLYPENLKSLLDSPIVLFWDGNIALNDKKIISIVGTRQATSYGIGFCQNFLQELSLYKDELVVVSGFAYGIDIAAHKKAIELGIQTVACLAHGLDHLYPSSHKKYRDAMVKNGGFFTDFWHNCRFDRKNFLKRNRIIAGLSQATILVESALEGGGMITASLAGKYKRKVFALPGRATDPYSQGCNSLIRDKAATILTSTSFFIESLGWDRQAVEKKHSPISKSPLLFSLPKNHQRVYEHLQRNGNKSIDELCVELSIPVFELSDILFQMELDGLIVALAGKVFSIS